MSPFRDEKDAARARQARRIRRQLKLPRGTVACSHQNIARLHRISRYWCIKHEKQYTTRDVLDLILNRVWDQMKQRVERFEAEFARVLEADDEE